MLYSRSRVRRLAAVAVIAVLALAAFGFAAANTVPASNAGDGAGTVSGYTVSSINYNLNAANPQNIDSVTFSLDRAPAAGATMQIKLVAAGATWYSCTNAGANLTCNTTAPQATVVTADELRVVVAD